MRSIELSRYDDKSFLVIMKGDIIVMFVTCTNYDKNKEYGNQWCWGHYFETFEDATKYWREEVVGLHTFLAATTTSLKMP